MLDPIDFLHAKQPRQGYLLDPHKIQSHLISILENNTSKEQPSKSYKSKEWSDENIRKFTLLNRLIWAISILDTIDDYPNYSKNDFVTFFVAFNTFCDITYAFGNSIPKQQNLFIETMSKDVFTDDIVQSRNDRSFVSFIRALSFAHTTNTNRGGNFLKEDTCRFILNSIDSQSAAPTDDELNNKPKAFYFHVLVSKNGTSKPQIFKVFVDELKEFLKAHYDNCSFEKLKEKKNG